MIEWLKYLFDNFDKLTDEENIYLSSIIDQLINKQVELDELEKKLLIKYAIREKCQYYGYPIINVEFLDEKNVPEDKKGTGGWYDPKKETIIITHNTLKNFFREDLGYPFYSEFSNELERMIFASLHECEHYFQHYDFANNQFNLRTYYWTIYKISKMNNPTEYSVNYSYKQIENHANIHGWHDTGVFLAKHHYKGNTDIIPFFQSTARQELSHQKAEKTDLIEYYNVLCLIWKCKESPYLIENYPILKEFFVNDGNEKGSLKNLNLLVSQYNQLERHHKSTEEKQIIYHEFFNFLFNKDINLINNNCGLIVLDLITSDLISLQGIFDYTNSKESEKRNVIRKKVNRIIKYYDVIERLNLLNVQDAFGSIIDIITDRFKEMLKVYETSKSMYNNYDEKIEIIINELRNRFSYFDVELRNEEGRKSAINI